MAVGVVVCLLALVVFFVFGDLGGALVFGRGTLYMKWRAALTRDEHETRSSTGVERQRELVNHNLTYFIFSLIS